MTLGEVGNADGEVGRAWTMEGLICNITHVTEAFEKQPEKDTSFCKKESSLMSIRELQQYNEARSQTAEVKQQVGDMEADMALQVLGREGRRDWIETSVEPGCKFVLE